MFPSEFSRSIRSLNEFDRWKATELRNFLIYAFPVIMDAFLPEEYFRHFMLLHFAVVVFSHKIYCQQYFQHAKACLKRFVQEASALYTNHCMVYNTHQLLHLPACVQEHGILSEFSAFPFESFYCQISKRLRQKRNILPQIVSQYSYLFNQDKYIAIPTISCNYPNNIMSYNDDYFYVVEKNDIEMKAAPFLYNRELYSYPYLSSCVKIGVYELQSTTTIIPVINVTKKCMGFKLGGKQYALFHHILYDYDCN